MKCLSDPRFRGFKGVNVRLAGERRKDTERNYFMRLKRKNSCELSEKGGQYLTDLLAVHRPQHHDLVEQRIERKGSPQVRLL